MGRGTWQISIQHGCGDHLSSTLTGFLPPSFLITSMLGLQAGSICSSGSWPHNVARSQSFTLTLSQKQRANIEVGVASRSMCDTRHKNDLRLCFGMGYLCLPRRTSMVSCHIAAGRGLWAQTRTSHHHNQFRDSLTAASQASHFPHIEVPIIGNDERDGETEVIRRIQCY